MVYKLKVHHKPWTDKFYRVHEQWLSTFFQVAEWKTVFRTIFWFVINTIDQKFHWMLIVLTHLDLQKRSFRSTFIFIAPSKSQPVKGYSYRTIEFEKVLLYALPLNARIFLRKTPNPSLLVKRLVWFKFFSKKMDYVIQSEFQN